MNLKLLYKHRVITLSDRLILPLSMYVAYPQNKYYLNRTRYHNENMLLQGVLGWN